MRSRPCLADPPAESPSTTKISLSGRDGDEQSLSLPGSVRRLDVALLRVTSCCAARLASRARAARMIRPTIASATLRFSFSHSSSAGRTMESTADEHLGVVQPVLRLPLELRLLHEDAEHADQAFADVLRGDRHALRREVVRLDVVAHRLAEPRAEAVLVRAARAGRDAVDVAPQELVGRLGPLQHELGAEAVLLERA